MIKEAEYNATAVPTSKALAPTAPFVPRFSQMLMDGRLNNTLIRFDDRVMTINELGGGADESSALGNNNQEQQQLEQSQTGDQQLQPPPPPPATTAMTTSAPLPIQVTSSEPGDVAAAAYAGGGEEVLAPEPEDLTNYAVNLEANLRHAAAHTIFNDESEQHIEKGRISIVDYRLGLRKGLYFYNKIMNY